MSETRNPFYHRGGRRGGWGCRAPGCPACFYDRFSDVPLAELERHKALLESTRPRVGFAWPGSGYFRALSRVIADKRRAVPGPNPVSSGGKNR